MARISSPVLLHPMSVVGICRTILLVYLRKLPQLFLWALLFLILPVLATIYFVVIAYSTQEIQNMVAFAILLLLGWAVAIVWFYAVAAIVMSLAVENWRASAWQILRRLAGRISLHLLLTVAVSWMVLIGGYILAGWLPISVILELAGALIFFRLAVSWCLTPAVIVLEGLSFRRAISRSSHLLRGHLWRTIAAMILCNTVLVFLLVLLIRLESLQYAVPYYILSGCMIALFAGAGICLPIFLYFDVRCRKEAFHLETLREY